MRAFCKILKGEKSWSDIPEVNVTLLLTEVKGAYLLSIAFVKSGQPLKSRATMYPTEMRLVAEEALNVISARLAAAETISPDFFSETD